MSELDSRRFGGLPLLRPPVTLGRAERTRRFVLTESDALTPAP